MERVSKDQPHSQENTPRLNGQAKDGAGPTCVAGTKKGRPPDLSPGNDNAKLVHEAHLVGATPMFRNLAIRKTEHAPVKVSLDRSIDTSSGPWYRAQMLKGSRWTILFL